MLVSSGILVLYNRAEDDSIADVSSSISWVAVPFSGGIHFRPFTSAFRRRCRFNAGHVGPVAPDASSCFVGVRVRVGKEPIGAEKGGLGA